MANPCRRFTCDKIELRLSGGKVVGVLLSIMLTGGCVEGPTGEMRAADESPAFPLGEWVSLFDGQSLDGWKKLEEDAFVGKGPVRVENGSMILARGGMQTGVRWTGDFPRDNYEVLLDAMRVDGRDFFCGLTFPVGDEPCTLICGGWGGMVVGLSNVDDMHAAENLTTTSMQFENDKWYRIHLEVTSDRIRTIIDDEVMIDLEREDHRFSVWWEQSPVKPFGVSTWDTGGAIRNIQVRRTP